VGQRRVERNINLLIGRDLAICERYTWLALPLPARVATSIARQHTLENAEQLELVVDIGLLLLQVNRACALLAVQRVARAIDVRLTAFDDILGCRQALSWGIKRGIIKQR
jgi:hypothetical protein